MFGLKKLRLVIIYKKNNTLILLKIELLEFIALQSFGKVISFLYGKCKRYYF